MSNERNAVVVAGGNGQDTHGVTSMVTKSGAELQMAVADEVASLGTEFIARRLSGDIRGMKDALDCSYDQQSLELAQLQLERVSAEVAEIASNLNHRDASRRTLAKMCLSRCKTKIRKVFHSIFAGEDTESLDAQVDEAIDDMVKTSQAGGTITHTEEAEARRLLDLYHTGQLYEKNPGGKGGFGKLLLE